MKSVSIEEIGLVQENTFNEFMKLFPALIHKPKTDQEVKDMFLAKEELLIHMVRIISHYRVFVDKINKAHDFQVFSEELFMRQLEHYKETLAKKDNGDFNEVK